MKDTNTILIIEDETSLLDALSDKCKKEGYRVFTAKNGKNGLSLALEHHPDVILLDIVMPIMDGISFLEEIRKDPWGKTASIIILTNLTGSEEVSKSTGAGVYDYLVKSDWSLKDVIVKIEEKIGKKNKK